MEILLIIGLVGFGAVWFTASVVFAVKNGGIGDTGKTKRCANCGGTAKIIEGWWGSFSRCPKCGDKQNINRSTQMQNRLDSGYYKK